MKKIKLILLIMLLTCFINVNETYALTSQERADIMKEQLENYHFDFKYVDMSDNYELIKKHHKQQTLRPLDSIFLTGLVRSELENIIDFEVNDAIDIECYLEGSEYVSGYDENHFSIMDTRKSDGCSFIIYLNNKNYTDSVSIPMDITGNFEKVVGNEEIKKESKLLVEKIIDDVYVADVDMLNHYINYKSTSSTFFSGNNALLEFANLKRLVEEYPEYDFFVGYEDTRRGAAYVSFAEGSTYVSKDGIVYGFTYNTYTSANMFFVPIGTEISKYDEVLEKRLKEYVNDESVEIKILPFDENYDNFLDLPNADVGYTFANNLNIDIDDYYKKVGTNSEKEKDKLYYKDCDTEKCIAMQGYQLFINGERYEIGIAEMDIETLNKFGTILSKDSKTGIILKTSAGNVPLDAKLKVENFKLTDKEKELLNSLGYTSIGAYNFQLYSIILDKVISNFSDVTHILIPLDNKWSKNLKIIYLSDDLKTIEYYTPDIVTYEGNKYLQFSTKHFSNYVIAEYELENPNTSDNIMFYIILSFASIIGITLCMFNKKLKINK